MAKSRGTFIKGYNGTPEERFWRHTEKREENECWNWTGSKYPKGYGCFFVNDRQVGTHRFSYELHKKKKIPKGLHVLHSCDNPPCVNPRHLWLGTNSDNVKDKIKKGRGVHPILKGENNPMAKLTWKKVEKIRRMHKSKKYTQRYISKIFKICFQNISDIVNNKRWKIP